MFLACKLTYILSNMDLAAAPAATIVFVLDTSASMNQIFDINLTYLETAKAFIRIILRVSARLSLAHLAASNQTATATGIYRQSCLLTAKSPLRSR